MWGRTLAPAARNNVSFEFETPQLVAVLISEVDRGTGFANPRVGTSRCADV